MFFNNLAKLNKFKKQRTSTWSRINFAFNPQDAWRERPRNYVRQLISPGVRQHVTYKSGLAYEFKNSLNLPNLSNFFIADPLLSQQGLYATSQFLVPKNTRIINWHRLVTRTVGFFTTLKLKYKGKSFRWHRKARSLLLRFGHSHLVFSKPKPGIFWRKHGRQKIIFWGANRWYLWRFLKNTVAWRPMNIYHGRGLRLTKQKVWRKSGKVSAYR